MHARIGRPLLPDVSASYDGVRTTSVVPLPLLSGGASPMAVTGRPALLPAGTSAAVQERRLATELQQARRATQRLQRENEQLLDRNRKLAGDLNDASRRAATLSNEAEEAKKLSTTERLEGFARLLEAEREVEAAREREARANATAADLRKELQRSASATATLQNNLALQHTALEAAEAEASSLRVQVEEGKSALRRVFEGRAQSFKGSLSAVSRGLARTNASEAAPPSPATPATSGAASQPSPASPSDDEPTPTIASGASLGDARDRGDDSPETAADLAAVAGAVAAAVAATQRQPPPPQPPLQHWQPPPPPWPPTATAEREHAFRVPAVASAPPPLPSPSPLRSYVPHPPRPVPQPHARPPRARPAGQYLTTRPRRPSTDADEESSDGGGGGEQHTSTGSTREASGGFGGEVEHGHGIGSPVRHALSRASVGEMLGQP